MGKRVFLSLNQVKEFMASESESFSWKSRARHSLLTLT